MKGTSTELRRVRAAAAVTAAGGLAAAGAGRRASFRRAIAGRVDDLLTRGSRLAPGIVTEAEVAGLPDPVRRWMEWSRAMGRARPAWVRLSQEGRFNLKGRGWAPFTAEQHFTMEPPAFLWSVSMRLLPFLHVTGFDSYQDGTGSLRMQISSLVPIVDKMGGGLDQGDLLRFLGETVWFPGAALAPYIKWEAIDSTSAMATMNYAGTSGSARFTFDQAGRPVLIAAERFNDSSGALESWSIPFLEFDEFDGIRMPVEGTGVWHFEDGDLTYIRWRITELEFNRPSTLVRGGA